MSAKMRELTFQGANMQDIRKAAVSEGMNTLYADGINKVLNGITTLDEVFRVSKKEVESAA
jgi:type IV pilus assembly protein PilB